MTELSTETYILYNKTISGVQNVRGRNVLVRNVRERNVLVQKDTWRKTIICIPYGDQICLKSERKAIWGLRNVGKKFILFYFFFFFFCCCFFKTACLKMYRIVVVFFLQRVSYFGAPEYWQRIYFVCFLNIMIKNIPHSCLFFFSTQSRQLYHIWRLFVSALSLHVLSNTITVILFTFVKFFTFITVFTFGGP